MRRRSIERELECVECGRVSGEDERGSTAHLTDDKPEEVVVFCSECDEGEFGEPAE